MDITILFKACVKTVQTRNKAFGDVTKKPDLFKKTPKDPNLIKAKDIIKQITNLQNFLNENRKAYVNVTSHFTSSVDITEFDREQIDTNSKEILTTCGKLVLDLKTETSQRTQSKQLAEHYANVIVTSENYLKAVGKTYAEQKAVRIKRALDNRKIAKLEIDFSAADATTVSSTVIPDKSLPISVEDQLSREEMQMFESENESLFSEMNSVSEEIQQIESKVVHISELQEAFTEKVLQQEKDIERIATSVVGATENMRDANDQIRQAIQRNAGLRVWILFFLLVMSFSLLFLDWYND